MARPTKANSEHWTWSEELIVDEIYYKKPFQLPHHSSLLPPRSRSRAPAVARCARSSAAKLFVCCGSVIVIIPLLEVDDGERFRTAAVDG
jgi:hypothetical protein